MFLSFLIFPLHFSSVIFYSFQDSEDEDEYYDPKKRPVDEGYAESQF